MNQKQIKKEKFCAQITERLGEIKGERMHQKQ